MCVWLRALYTRYKHSIIIIVWLGNLKAKEDEKNVCSLSCIDRRCSVKQSIIFLICMIWLWLLFVCGKAMLTIALFYMWACDRDDCVCAGCERNVIRFDAYELPSSPIVGPLKHCLAFANLLALYAVFSVCLRFFAYAYNKWLHACTNGMVCQRKMRFLGERDTPICAHIVNECAHTCALAITRIHFFWFAQEINDLIFQFIRLWCTAT